MNSNLDSQVSNNQHTYASIETTSNDYIITVPSVSPSITTSPDLAAPEYYHYTSDNVWKYSTLELVSKNSVYESYYEKIFNDIDVLKEVAENKCFFRFEEKLHGVFELDVMNNKLAYFVSLKFADYNKIFRRIFNNIFNYRSIRKCLYTSIKMVKMEDVLQ